jgi:hypothetical protein
MILQINTTSGKQYLAGFYGDASPMWTLVEARAEDHPVYYLKQIADVRLKLESYNIRERVHTGILFGR